MKKTEMRLLVTLLIAIAIGGFTGSAYAQADNKGLWRSDDMPKTLWVTKEIVVEDNDMLGLFWLDEVPKSAKECTEDQETCRNRAFDWSIFLCRDGGDVWQCQQATGMGYQSSTRVDWKFIDTDNAEMTLRACDEGDCGDFDVGDVIKFKRVYGDTGDPPASNGHTPGTWQGWTSDYEACFNIDPSGTKITTTNSRCQNGNSYNFKIEEGTDPDDGDDCNFDFYGQDPIQINNGKFSYSERFSGGWHDETKYVTGIIEGDKARGTLKKVDHKWGNHCEGTWEATAPISTGMSFGIEATVDPGFFGNTVAE